MPGAPPPQQASGVGSEGGEKVTRRKKGRDKRKGGKEGEEDAPAEVGEQTTNGPTTFGANEASSSAPADPIAAPEPTAAEGGLDPLQKKIRNLTKKVCFRPRWCMTVYKGILTWHFPSPGCDRHSAQGYRGTQGQSEDRCKARDDAVQKDRDRGRDSERVSGGDCGCWWRSMNSKRWSGGEHVVAVDSGDVRLMIIVFSWNTIAFTSQWMRAKLERG